MSFAKNLINWLFLNPRRILLIISASGVGMLLFAIYLQEVVGVVPCPMCIIQRYSLIGVTLITGIACIKKTKIWLVSWTILALIFSLFGSFVAARQSWLQWFPPENYSCGRDFYGMIERYSFGEWLPMLFRGSGDCLALDWTFLGGSIANWSFLSFISFSFIFIFLIVKLIKS